MLQAASPETHVAAAPSSVPQDIPGYFVVSGICSCNWFGVVVAVCGAGKDCGLLFLWCRYCVTTALVPSTFCQWFLWSCGLLRCCFAVLVPVVLPAPAATLNVNLLIRVSCRDNLRECSIVSYQELNKWENNSCVVTIDRSGLVQRGRGNWCCQMCCTSVLSLSLS